MEFELIKLREDMIKESGYLLKNMSSHLDSKITRYVNFSLEFLENPVAVPVFYSTKYRYWSARYKDHDELIHAFGMYDEQEFMMANFKPRALNPLFVFALPINYEPVKYEALFVRQGKEMHLMPKIYDLNEDIKDYLIKEGLVLELEDEDYLLFDFGNSHRILKFLNRVKRNVKTFNFELNDSGKLTINLNPYKTFVDNKGYNYCMMCGAKLNVAIHKELKELSEKFEAKCEHCLEKIHALDFYFKLKEDSISKYISEESIKSYFDDENSAYYMWSLLVKFNMLNHFTGDLYTLQPNSYIEESFIPLLKAPEPEISETKSKLDDYWSQYDDEDEEDEEERFCEICGKHLETELGDICDDCFNKKEAVKSLKNLLEYVSPGVGFSKSDLLKQGFSILELDILVDDLVNVGLLKSVGDDNLFILEKTSVLNNFIEEYSDEELIDSKKELGESKLIPSIRSIDLATEESLDKVFNLVNYTKNVYSSYDRRIGKWYVEFKDDGKTLVKKMFKTPFEAKLSAVNYLAEMNLINIISDNEEEVSIDVKGEEPKICPVCGNEFIPSNSSQKYCDDCRSKYNGVECKVLTLINKGKITQETSNKISDLLDKGKTKVEISRILKLDNESFVNPILKFLPQSSEESDKNTKKRVCPVCNKEFYIDSSSSQKYCDECKNKYNFMELMALVLINNKRITQKTSNSIAELLNKGLSKKEIRERLNLGNASLIDPILKFLPPNEEYKEVNSEVTPKLENKVEKEPVKLSNIEPRTCAFCGDTFYPSSRFSSSQKYCKDCTSKYTTADMTVIKGILFGTFNKESYENILELQKQKKTKIAIAKELSLPSTDLIGPILRFLGPDAEEIPSKVIRNFSNRGFKIRYRPQRKAFTSIKPVKQSIPRNVAQFDPNNEIVIDVFGEDHYNINSRSYDEDSNGSKICPVCGLEFNPKHPDQKYCEDCDSKYSVSEKEVLSLIKDGTIDEIISGEVKRLRIKGYCDKDIARKLDFKHAIWVKHVLKFAQLINVEIKEDSYPKVENKINKFSTTETRICPICLSEFEVKSNSTKRHCDDCRAMYSFADLEALTLINTGEITKIDSNKMYELISVGVSNNEIAKRFKLKNTETIYSIFKFLAPENKSNLNKFENISSEKPYKWFKVVKYSDHINVILEGLISNKDRFALFTRSSFLDEFNLNYIECRKADKYFEIKLDLNFRKNEAKSHINKFKAMGWVEK